MGEPPYICFEAVQHFSQTALFPFWIVLVNSSGLPKVLWTDIRLLIGLLLGRFLFNFFVVVVLLIASFLCISIYAAFDLLSLSTAVYLFILWSLLGCLSLSMSETWSFWTKFRMASFLQCTKTNCSRKQWFYCVQELLACS